MTKKIFLKLLRKRLHGISRREVNDRISFYSEMIDDRVEEGLSEAEAIDSIGSVDEVARAVLEDSRTEKRIEMDGASSIPTVLLICGFPIWLPLLASLYAVLFSLLATYLSVVVSLWASFASFSVGAPAGIIYGIYSIFAGNAAYGGVMIASGLICIGLAVLTFYASLYLTRLIGTVTKALFAWTKILFKRRIRL